MKKKNTSGLSGLTQEKIASQAKRRKFFFLLEAESDLKQLLRFFSQFQQFFLQIHRQFYSGHEMDHLHSQATPILVHIPFPADLLLLTDGETAGTIRLL